MSIEDRASDPYRAIRAQIILQLRPTLLGVLGVTESEVTEEPVSKSFPTHDGTEITCSAARLGPMLVCSVTTESDFAIAHSEDVVQMKSIVRHEFIGESDLSREVSYVRLDEAGETIDEEILEEPFRKNPNYYAETVNLFNDFEFLKRTLSSLM